jgi:hypothetical protein
VEKASYLTGSCNGPVGSAGAGCDAGSAGLLAASLLVESLLTTYKDACDGGSRGSTGYSLCSACKALDARRGGSGAEASRSNLSDRGRKRVRAALSDADARM